MTVDLDAARRDQILNTIRFLAVDAVEKAKSGHPGTPMALAGPAFVIWDRHMRFDPGDPEWPLRDRFVLSAGHASMLLYGLLHLYGYDLDLDALRSFRQLHSATPGHPEYGDTPGVEVTTGPLGQGFGHAVGMALAARMTRSHFEAGDDGPGNHRVYGIVSDGDLMEGISHEAGSIAGHLGLGNLILLYDDNRITIDGSTDLAFSEDVRARFEAQRWHVEECDGTDLDAIDRAVEAARGETARPSMIVCRTTIGIGSPNKAGTSKAHGAPLGADEVKLTKENLGWPLDPGFLVPDDVRSYFVERTKAKREERAARDAAFEAWRSAHAEAERAWQTARARRVPDDLCERLAEVVARKEAATRKHSAAVIQQLAASVPYLVGGSADLAESNLTRIEEGGDVGPAVGDGDRFAGRNIHYGIREHGMAAITNGIALDGTFLPYGGTFLIFSDYARPAIRLAALMGARSNFVFTHDSVFLGEDGPTHQPVEHLDALRAIPDLHVFRPADGVETAASWAWIAARAEGPAMLALSRQGLPALDRPAAFVPRDVWKGAYCVHEPDDAPVAVLVASGSEVSLAVAAAGELASAGMAVRVVSMPCMELFAAQDPAYRTGLLPDDGTPAIAIEAARGDSYRRWVGSRGLVIGIDRFGASAPHEALADYFGFTPAKVAARVRAHLGAR